MSESIDKVEKSDDLKELERQIELGVRPSSFENYSKRVVFVKKFTTVNDNIATQAEVRTLARKVIGYGATYSNKNATGRMFKYWYKDKSTIKRLAEAFGDVDNVQIYYDAMFVRIRVIGD